MKTQAIAKNKVTKTDIARELGVSRTCVSLVLSQQPSTRISKATRQKVIQTARAMGYEENAVTHSDRALNQIAYVFCSHAHTGGLEKSHWHIALLVELQQLAMTQDQALTFYYTNTQPEALDATLRLLDKVHPAGVVLDGWVPRHMVDAMLERQLPFVVAGVTPYAYEKQWQGRVSTVSLDISNTMNQLVEILRQRGARRIGLIVGHTYALINKLLIESYRKHMTASDLGYEPSFVQIAESPDGTDVMSRFEELGVEIDGLICSSAHTTAILTFLRTQSPSPLKLQRIVAIGNVMQLPTNGRQLTCLDINPTLFAKAVHQLLSDLIYYGPHRQKNVSLPLTLHHGN